MKQLNILSNIFGDYKSKEGTKFINNNVFYFNCINYKNVKAGKICLVAAADEYYKTIRSYVMMMILVMIFLILLSYLVASLLQKFISKPILELASFLEVGNWKFDSGIQKNLLLMPEVKSNDEINILYNASNNMLEQINTRD